MATFSNLATLSFNGTTTNSNLVTGEILEDVMVSKIHVNPNYFTGDDITYAVTIRNLTDQPLTGITLTDDLGRYNYGTNELYPLDFIPFSVRLFNDGTMSMDFSVTMQKPLTITGLSVAANGVTMVLYTAKVNQYAPVTFGSRITNTATVSYAQSNAESTATSTIYPRPTTELAVHKSLEPKVVGQDRSITYRFEIENSGTLPTNMVSETERRCNDTALQLIDIFQPKLTLSSVSLNGEALTKTVDYQYDSGTGKFVTMPNRIVVPAATFRRGDDGTVIVEPGKAVLVIKGTLRRQQ